MLTSLSPEAIGILAFVIALVLVTFLHVVVGEMVPKNISFSVPTRAALILAPPLVLVSKIVKPVIWSFNGIANGILRSRTSSKSWSERSRTPPRPDPGRTQ